MGYWRVAMSRLLSRWHLPDASFWACAGIAAGLHGLVLLAIGRVVVSNAVAVPATELEPDNVAVDVLGFFDSVAVPDIPAFEPPATLPSPPVNRPQPPEPEPMGVVVDTPKTNGEEPEDADFVAEQASNPMHQSRQAIAGDKAPMPGPQPGRRSPREDDEAPIGAEAAVPELASSIRQDAEPAGFPVSPGVGLDDDFGLPPRGPVQPQMPSAPVGRAASGAGESEAKQPPIVTVGPSAKPDDLLIPLPEGEDTLLKARASMTAAFLNEVRERVRRNWHSRDVYRKADPAGRLGDQHFVTVLGVKIRSDGSIERAEVDHRSGLAALDAEATGAIRRSGPFSKPPREILDDGGAYAFRFRFVLDVSLNSFLRDASRAMHEHWRPSMAFQRVGDHDRLSIARLYLSPEGKLVRAEIKEPSGMDLLDRNVMEALTPGLAFPPPPSRYPSQNGLHVLEVEFHHRVRKPAMVAVSPPTDS